MPKFELILLISVCLATFCNCVLVDENENSSKLDHVFLFMLKELILAQTNNDKMDAIEALINYYKRIKRIHRFIKQMNRSKSDIVNLTNFLRF